MAKKVETYIKLQIKAAEANPSPPIGPALGARGVNIMGFCKMFNEQTSKMNDVEKGTLLPVVITVYTDRSFTFIIKSPPASVLLKKAAKITKGSGVPNKEKVGSVTYAQLEEIAQVKSEDLTAGSKAAAIRIIAGTASSMGLNIEGM